MSDFDFDALRDPDAPQPGARERAGVDARASQLRARTRRTRVIGGATSLVAVLAIVLVSVVITRPDDSTITVRGPGTTTSPTFSGVDAGNRFLPPTRFENGLVVLPVTLPNGETFTLRYPSAMEIAQLGFAGGINVNYPVQEGELHCCGKQVRITYESVTDVYGHATPDRLYEGVNGEPVYYFHSSQALQTIVPQLDFLVFQFGPWLVQVYDVQQSGDNELRMTDAQRRTWARSLSGTLDSNGYLLLHAAAPLSLGDTFEGGFGDATGNTVELANNAYCDQPGSDTNVRRPIEDEGGRGVAWCEGDLHIAASGDAKFVFSATNDLQVDVGYTRPFVRATGPLG